LKNANSKSQSASPADNPVAHPAIFYLFFGFSGGGAIESDGLLKLVSHTMINKHIRYSYKFCLSTQTTGIISSKASMLNAPHPFQKVVSKILKILHIYHSNVKKLFLL